MLHNLISADREGKWEGHLQAIQDRLPFFFVKQTASTIYNILLGT